VFQLAEELRFAPPSAPVKTSAALRKAVTRPAPAASSAGRRGKLPPPAPTAATIATSQSPATGAATEETSQSPAIAADVEEVVIPDVPSPVPVEKQMREPTAFELAEIEFRDAVARLRQGRVVDAEAGFRAALKADRSHAAARQALIGVLIDSGRNADAEDVLRETLAVNPAQPRHAMLLARLELKRGDAAAAAKTLEAARYYAGVDADFFAFQAAVHQRLGSHQEAVDLYANALTVAPDNAVWMMGLGISLQALERKEEARAVFRRAADSRTLNADLQAFVEAQLRELPAPKP
jgi:MSHA biogenesis protein MshN